MMKNRVNYDKPQLDKEKVFTGDEIKIMQSNHLAEKAKVDRSFKNRASN